MKLWKHIIIALAAAAFFSLAYAAGIFSGLEERVYDFFLRFRIHRERTDKVVFLDVDDDAIAYNGVFPWPRSVTADGLLRLKEFGALAAIFDIEFIDKGPQGVDSIYLQNGLPADFDRSFDEINSAAQDVLSALKANRINRTDIDSYAQSLSQLINNEHDGLFAKSQGIARDNDLYLAQTLALLGKSWMTLNLRPDALSGEQAERRALAQERFSYPVHAAPGAYTGKFVDILPALPAFASAAEGAGFTNVEIDPDGIRRRIYLTQKIHDHWYLQLAFAPLVDYLGRPELELDRRRLLIKGAALPGAAKKDIAIPLDSGGRMMIDWPPEDYQHSFRHISFDKFSLLEDIELQMQQYCRALESADLHFFAGFDSSLTRAIFITGELANLFDAIQAARTAALEQCSEEEFASYTAYRARSRELIRELLDLDAGTKITALAPSLSAEFPEDAGAIGDMAEYIKMLVDYLAQVLEQYEDTSEKIKAVVNGNFCILGRVDTGTTDIGANPFWGEYVNVGTHAVVLDMILSESFIIALRQWWSVLFMLLFVPVFFLVSAKLNPVPRAASGFVITALVVTASLLLFRFAGIFFAPLGTVLAMVSAVVVREIMSYAGSEREKQFIHKAFSTYVSDEVVKEIIADPSRLQLGGTKRHMSAIFTDIQGFSTISEQLDPEDLVSLLNRYLTAMSDVILAEKGTIDKYEGDAIIAFFGAPLEQPDHALRACLSAIAMKRLEKELNQAIIADKLSPSPLFTRIGLNTGSMVAGNMGTKDKMNYTIMGNAVNLAARLEGVNKQYGTGILAPENTVREAGESILARRLDRVRVVGINEPVQIYELLNTAADATAEQRKLVAMFHEALNVFEARNWRMAAQGFREILSLSGDDGPSKKFFTRCKNFLSQPPADDWDGVFGITEK